jgi:tRNA(adenine34) deaminase
MPSGMYLRTMTYHERFMRAALELASRARDLHEVPVGAVVVRDGEIVASAHNETIARADPTAHAELLAIQRALVASSDGRLDGCSLYVTLEPCPMCAGAIVLARLRQVVFGAFDAKAGAAGTLYTITNDARLNHCVETHGGVLDDQCASVLREFFRSQRV